MLRPANVNNGVGQYYLVMDYPEALVFELPIVPIRTMRYRKVVFHLHATMNDTCNTARIRKGVYA